MIVRIFSDGQYRVPEDACPRLNELDLEAVAALDADDEAAFRQSFDALVEHIHRNGERLADDDLEPSDLILPPADISVEEARRAFTGEGRAGLLPD